MATDKSLTPQQTQRLSRASRESITSRKERLFANFFRSGKQTLRALEEQFNVKGVCEQVFGEEHDDFDSHDEQRMHRLRSNRAWATLSALYDYAVEGLDYAHDGPSSLVIDGSDVLWLVTSENHWPSDEWRDIVAMADGRFALDDGQPVDHYKVALLANVDLRTVRNAISAGDLIALKEDDFIFIENASARRWLHGRKGFKPTVIQSAVQQDIAVITAPSVFGAFLRDRRCRLGIESGNVVVMHPSVTAEGLAQLESGVFSLSLNTVFPLADFYQIGRKAFLVCVMRVFFSDELQLLRTEPQV